MRDDALPSARPATTSRQGSTDQFLIRGRDRSSHAQTETVSKAEGRADDKIEDKTEGKTEVTTESAHARNDLNDRARSSRHREGPSNRLGLHSSLSQATNYNAAREQQKRAGSGKRESHKSSHRSSRTDREDGEGPGRMAHTDSDRSPKRPTDPRRELLDRLGDRMPSPVEAREDASSKRQKPDGEDSAGGSDSRRTTRNRRDG